MGFLSSLFGNQDDGRSHQLPSSMVCKEFGEVNVRRDRKVCDVSLTVLMEPTGSAAEGWQTGVALDASGSMESVFGRGIESVPGRDLPDGLLAGYHSKGWLKIVEHQGQQVPILSREAKADLVKKGYFRWTKNEIEPLSRKMTAYLAANLDADGGTTVIYWACGDGSEIEPIGDFTADDCETASFGGPNDLPFGQGTVLTPAVRYFADRFADAKNGMYIFVTDGELHDLEEVKQYTIKLCRAIQAQKRNPIKCVLIGIGDDINESQMEELDDLDSGTDVDIWDHKIAKDMRSLVEIFAEVVSEHQIVAPTGRLFDDTGKLIKNFTDGLPAKLSFSMPASSKYFELEVGDRRIRQGVLVANA